MSSLQLFPEVQDKSNLGASFSQALFLAIGVEGQADPAAAATVGQIYPINRPSEADTQFGSTSPLAALVKFILSRGVSPVLAVASIKSNSPPILGARQAAWANLESDPRIRIRMTDDTAQATHVALADSCENAALLYNKQIGFGGLAAGTTKAALISAAAAIASKRFVLVGPGVYNLSGVLLSGNYASAVVASEVAKNSDISDDLDLDLLINLIGIEVGAQGIPIFQNKVVSGSVVNDFEDLLQGGVSPLMTDRSGTGVRITHLRTTFNADTSLDALETALIVDQVFLDVRDYVTNNNFFRRGNNIKTRADLQAGVEALLLERSNWITGILQPDGRIGYGVAVISSGDNRQVTIRYQGVVQRNIQTVVVDAQLSIPV